MGQQACNFVSIGIIVAIRVSLALLGDILAIIDVILDLLAILCAVLAIRRCYA